MGRKLVSLEDIKQYTPEERAGIILQLVVGELLSNALSNASANRISQLPIGQRALYLISIFDGQICNGGFHQYFSNSSGDFAHYTVASLRYVQANESALLLKEALDKFPGRRAAENRSERQLQLSAINLPGTKRAEWDPFYALDDRYYKIRKTAENPWSKVVESLDNNLKDFLG